MKETVTAGNLKFEIRRSSRRKKLGLTVDRGGELVVHSPATAGESELRQWIDKKLLWVHQKLLLKENHQGPTEPLEIVSGERIAYLGNNYRLKIVEMQDEPLWFDGEWFRLRKTDREEAPRHFQNWYEKAGGRWLKGRVKYWEPRSGRAPSGISIRDLGFRWGSCGKNGMLHFNWRLLQLQVRLIDYVIVHEFAHLHERNHTREFWKVLDRILPDWRERKSELGMARPEMVWCTNDNNETKEPQRSVPDVNCRTASFS